MSNAMQAPQIGANSENPMQAEQAEAPEYVSKAELAQMVNQAISGHLKRSLPKMIADGLAASKPQETDLMQSESKASEAQPWQKEMESLKRQVAEEKKLRKDANLRAATERATIQLAQELTGSGRLRPEAVPVVVDLLTKAQGRLSLNEDGEALYRLGPEDLCSLQEGAKAWLGSKEAQIFISPPVPQNSRGATRAPAIGTRVAADNSDDPLTRSIQALKAAGIDINTL